MLSLPEVASERALRPKIVIAEESIKLSTIGLVYDRESVEEIFRHRFAST